MYNRVKLKEMSPTMVVIPHRLKSRLVHVAGMREALSHPWARTFPDKFLAITRGNVNGRIDVYMYPVDLRANVYIYIYECVQLHVERGHHVKHVFSRLDDCIDANDDMVAITIYIYLYIYIYIG